MTFFYLQNVLSKEEEDKRTEIPAKMKNEKPCK